MTRNVVNTGEIESFVADMERRTPLAPVHEWLLTTYRNWLIKHAPAQDILPAPDADTLSEDTLVARDPATWRMVPYYGPVPEWLFAALCRGDRLVRVECGPVLERNAWLVIGWLNSLENTAMFGRLYRISYPQALEAAQVWRDRLALRESREQKAGDAELVYQFGDGFRIVDLKTPRALEREGDMMGHCAACYDDDLKDGTRILSLRDPHNRPHCTMEIFKGRVLQVKGKQNRAPVARYRPYVRQFISGSGFKLYGDANNVGMFFLNGRFCRDVNEYVAVWDREGGPELLNGIWVSTEPFRAIAKFADEMTEATRRRLFALLSRGYTDGARFEHVATLDIFGEPFAIVRVDYPFGLWFLKRRRVFRDPELRHEIDRIVEAGVSTLLDALETRPNWFFNLATEDEDWEGEEPSSIDLLTVSGFDLRQVRHQRSTRMRTRLAAIRRQSKGLMRDLSIPYERRSRWREDWKRVQTILQTRMEFYL